jgi:hypothetical protein
MRFLKILLMAGAIISAIGPSVVEARTAIYTMSCAQAQSYIRQKGAAVVDTGPRTFERIVANRSYCDFDQRIRPFYNKTRDVPKCNVGFECFRRIPPRG